MRKLYNVVLTESEATKTKNWQVKHTDRSDNLLAAGPLGRAMVYIANGVVAHNDRDAQAHAMELWRDEGLYTS